MFGTQVRQDAAPSSNPRFMPAKQSLNKNADGYVVSINITMEEIQKSRFESRLDWIRNGRQIPPKFQGANPGVMQTPMQQGGLFGGTQPLGGGSLAVGGGALGSGGLGGGLMQGGNQSLFGQPQPQAQPAASNFSLGGATSMFGQQQPPQQQQAGGLFSTLQPQNQGTPQQQNAGGLFGGLTQQTQPFTAMPTAQFGQQQPATFGLMTQNLTQAPAFGMNQQPQVQCHQCLHHSQGQQLPAADVQINICDADAYEQEQLQELERNFEYMYQPLSFPSDNPQQLNINIRKRQSQNQVGINITKKNQQSLRSTYVSTQGTASFSRRSNTGSQISMSQSLQNNRLQSRSSKVTKNAFYINLPQIKLKKLVTFKDLEMDDTQLQNYTVEQLVDAIKQHYLQDDANTYVAAFQGANIAEAPQVLHDSETLDNVPFTMNASISLLVWKQSVASRSSSAVSRQKNSNAPHLAFGKYQLEPSMEELKYLTDEQLRSVQNFKIQSEHALVEFLEPVDLFRAQIDKLVVIEQDMVDFYPDEFGVPKPDLGQGINVPTRISFFKFGSSTPGTAALKKDDFEGYCEKVRRWADVFNMRVIEMDHDKVIVEIDEV